MTLEKTLIRRVVLLGAFALGTLAVITTLAVAQTPSPALLMTTNPGHGQPTLEIIDPRTEKVVGRVPLSGGSYAHEVAVSDDGKLAYVAHTDFAKYYSGDAHYSGATAPIPGYISVIDLVAQKELRIIEIGPDSIPHDVRFVGGKLYFTAEGYQLVGCYDPATNKICWMYGIGIGGHILAVSKDGNKMATAGAHEESVAIVEPFDDLQERTGRKDGFAPMKHTVIPVGRHPEGIDMSPDGKEIWVANRRGASVSIIDVATKKVSETFAVKMRDGLRLKFTPDGKRVVILDDHARELVVIDAVTRKEIKRIPNLGIKGHTLLMTPDGSRAYVATGHWAKEGSSKIDVIDLKTLELTGHIVAGDDPDGLAWAVRK